jgi:TPR repeat protein
MSIYAINGYRVVPTKHHQRLAYFDLFPNPVARQQARDDRITPKNLHAFRNIMRKHDDETATLTTNQQNESEAAKYSQLSADPGNSDAQLNYCRCLRDGCGIPADRKAAERYLAAVQAHGMGN